MEFYLGFLLTMYFMMSSLFSRISAFSSFFRSFMSERIQSKLKPRRVVDRVRLSKGGGGGGVC